MCEAHDLQQSIQILLGHLPHPIPKWPLYQAQDEMLEIRCRERNSRSSFPCMPDRAVNRTHSCELHMIERCLREQAFLYTGQTAGSLGSAGSPASPPLCSQTLKQLDIWQMKKRHDINSNVTYLWTQDVDLQHKHMENHSWPWKNAELSATDPWGTVKF